MLWKKKAEYGQDGQETWDLWQDDIWADTYMK